MERRRAIGRRLARGADVTRVILILAAAVAVLGAMVTGLGKPGGLVWMVALLAALIMLRRTWSQNSDNDQNGET
jgi:hypothetical protein